MLFNLNVLNTRTNDSIVKWNNQHRKRNEETWSEKAGHSLRRWVWLLVRTHMTGVASQIIPLNRF